MFGSGPVIATGVEEASAVTLLSDIVKALHAAHVRSFSVHFSAVELPGDPDLVVTTAGDADVVTDLLSAAELPIWTVKQVSESVIHVWGHPDFLLAVPRNRHGLEYWT
jgi:hypothetical protein